MPSDPLFADRNILLIAVGVGVIVGVLFGSWLVMALQRLLAIAVKFAVIGCVILVVVTMLNTMKFQQRAPGNSQQVSQPVAGAVIQTHTQTPVPAASTKPWWK